MLHEKVNYSILLMSTRKLGIFIWELAKISQYVNVGSVSTIELWVFLFCFAFCIFQIFRECIRTVFKTKQKTKFHGTKVKVFV